MHGLGASVDTLQDKALRHARFQRRRSAPLTDRTSDWVARNKTLPAAAPQLAAHGPKCGDGGRASLGMDACMPPALGGAAARIFDARSESDDADDRKRVLAISPVPRSANLRKAARRRRRCASLTSPLTLPSEVAFIGCFVLARVRRLCRRQLCCGDGGKHLFLRRPADSLPLLDAAARCIAPRQPLASCSCRWR